MCTGCTFASSSLKLNKKSFDYISALLLLHAYRKKKTTRLSSRQRVKFQKKISWNFTRNFIQRKHHCVHLFCCHFCLLGGQALHSAHHISVVNFIPGEGKGKLICINGGRDEYIHFLSYTCRNLFLSVYVLRLSVFILDFTPQSLILSFSTSACWLCLCL